MRFDLCAVVIAVCIVALQCTANANNVPEGDQQSSDNLGEAVVATTTTTAPQKIAEVGVNTEGSERERTTGGEVQTDHQTEEEKAKVERAQAAARAEPAPLVAAEAEKTITTTTAANVDPLQVGELLGTAKQKTDQPADVHKPGDGATDKEDDADKIPRVAERSQEVAPVRAEREADAPQTATTTTASVKSVALPDNSQTGVQPPRTNTVVQTNSSPLSTPVREVTPGGPEPEKKKGGAQAKTTRDQSVSKATGEHASVPAVKDSAVTPPTSIAKKNNGADAGVQPNKNSGDKEIHQKQTPDATTTITEQQKAFADPSTTSSTTPTKETSSGMTSTLPKGFKIPQSVDKTDGISSVSLLFAFVTLATFAVTAVAPVH